MNSTNNMDPIRLEVFKHLFAAIPEEMGAVLRKSSYSPNIKERLDFSCALFDAEANLISQAAHIPVHLGAMPLSVQYALKEIELAPGDMVILNDPYRGGTHLPDITLIAPIFFGDRLFGFTANRAHHADVGGMTAGSMPIAQELYQEGLIIPPIKLIETGVVKQGNWDLILANVRTPVERAGDLRAQIAANQRGVKRMQELVQQYGITVLKEYGNALLDYAERMTRNLLAEIPNGEYSFADDLDDDGISDVPIPIKVSIKIEAHNAAVDFSGSAPQQKGSVNAVYAITLSAVYYVFRCLLSAGVPNNSGSLRPIQVIAPEGSVVNATHPAPVAGGNVETSQRITDVLLGALSQAVPDKIPAASQGTMNNTLIGGVDPRNNRSFTYYETICGGMGARPGKDGAAAIHTHMTNTLNTPIEALEFAYPLQVMCYKIREGTGGSGQFTGGDGVQRDIKLLTEAQATQLSDRRKTKPYGLAGGQDGSLGENILIRDGKETRLPAKGTFDVKTGDILSVRTPGGGGFGKE